MKKTLKKIISLIISAAIIATAVSGLWASASENEIRKGLCGNDVRWELNETDGHLKIFGSGEMYDYFYPWNSVGYLIDTITVGEGVTKIGNMAFYECYVTEAAIPSSVKVIGSAAFYGCEKLENIEIAQGVEVIDRQAFADCTSLASVSIPSSVTEIGYSAFNSCTSLKSISIPGSVKTLGESAFENCSGLESITMSSGTEIIGKYAFDECTALKMLVLPSTLKTLEKRAFYGCTSLESIDIPEGVHTIGEFVFEKCTSLSDITLPEGIKSIDATAFKNTAFFNDKTYVKDNTFRYGDYLLRFSYAGNDNSIVHIEDGIKVIADNAFVGSSDFARTINELHIPASVTVFNRNALSHSYLIQRIFVDEANTCYSSDESGVVYNKDKTVLVAYPAGKPEPEFTVPDTVKEIAPYAFNSCKYLESVVLPDGLLKIGEYAFQMNYYPSIGIKTINFPNTITEIGAAAFTQSNLSSVVLPEGLKEIESSAFSSCPSLKSVYIPGSITKIDAAAFSHSGLETVTIAENSSLKEIEENAFDSCSSLKSINLPDSVSYIGNEAFIYCSSLTNINIPDSLTAVKEFTFFNTGLTEVTIPNGIVNIEKRAFDACKGLNSINIADSAIHIEPSAFDFSTYLNSENCRDEYGVVYINNHLFKAPETLSGKYEIRPGTVSVTAGAFEQCQELTEVTIPDSVVAVNQSAFANCRKLQKINIASGSKIEAISEGAFYGCSKLSSINIPTEISEIGDFAFYQCESIKNLDLSKCTKLKRIGVCAFLYCYGLTQITFPSSLKEIDYQAFEMCKNISGLILPEGLETIGNNLTLGCETMKYIHIPSSVKRIGIDVVYDNTIICSDSSNSFAKKYADASGYIFHECNGNHSNYEILCKPSTTSMKYGEIIILHLNENIVPENAEIEWTSKSSAVKLSPSADGKSCKVESVENGSATVSVKITAENGACVSDCVELQSQVNFLHKLISFFKNLFGINRIISQSFIIF